MPARTIISVLMMLAFFMPTMVSAESPVDTLTFAKARVTKIVDEHAALIPGTGTKQKIQTLTAEIIDGPDQGALVTFENDYTQLKVGEMFYIRHFVSANDATDQWSVADPYRLPILGSLGILFFALLLMFGGVQGVRGLASLAGSIVLIILILVPGILQGLSPILVAGGVAIIIIVLGSYVTHGFNKTTTAAVLGMLGTVAITGVIAFWAVQAAHLSGYSSDETAALNFQLNGAIDIIGLLFAGIMIGLLGVLYDIAIGQAVAVEELLSAGSLTRREIYKKALRIGREHIGALVNTLAIAYVGVSLPLLLLVVSGSDAGVAFIINNELFATEIIRILVGSIGLILAVPITTFITTRLLTKSGTALH